jgi:hypothetical protein
MIQTIDITGDTNPNAFYSALEASQKGDHIIYHRGQHCGGLHRREASKAETERMCFLFCKRVADGVFAYIAVKR